MHIQQKRRRRKPPLDSAWTGLSGLFLLANLCHGAADECDAYNVQLQATFEYNSVIPCTDEESSTISALVHALLQTDVIVGMDGMPVREFYLAYETYGSVAVRLPSFEERDFTTTQMQLALPHYSVEDQLEDMYYDYDFNNTNRNLRQSDSALQKQVDDEDDTEQASDPYEGDPGVIQPFADSLRKASDSIEEDKDDKNPPSVNVTDFYDGQGCESDWCGFFFSRPCHSKAPRDAMEEESPEQYEAMVTSFQERVAVTIERKLRKWTRDSDCMCLGNSWELKAIVKKLD